MAFTHRKSAPAHPGMKYASASSRFRCFCAADASAGRVSPTCPARPSIFSGYIALHSSRHRFPPSFRTASHRTGSLSQTKWCHLIAIPLRPHLLGCPLFRSPSPLLISPGISTSSGKVFSRFPVAAVGLPSDGTVVVASSISRDIHYGYDATTICTMRNARM